METSSNENCFGPLADGEIRLLHLAPGKGNDPLMGRLECIDLQQNAQYEAISYEWGSPEMKHSITLDKKFTLPIVGALYNAFRDIRYSIAPEKRFTLRITDALYNALRDIRHETLFKGSGVIWADGICINQSDVEERQRQVSMMGAIYHKATQVITYMGPEKDDSSRAIDFAYDLWRYALEQKGKVDPRLHFPDELVNIGLPQASDPRWAALKALLLRGWSSRCWCAQEFLSNANLTMMCGRREILDWSLIPNIVQSVFNRSLPTFLLPISPEDPNSLRECLTALGSLRSQIVYHGRQLPLNELLPLFHQFSATDPRDKVYSLLGYASDRKVIGLPVDYSLTSEQLYIEVAIKLMESSPSLEILYSNLGKKSLKLPSWVPDWSTWQFGSNGMASYYTYSAGGLTTTNLQVNAAEQRLDITGCFVDKIVRCSERVGSYYQNNKSTAEFPKRSSWLRNQIWLVKNLEPYPDGSNIYDVFWRTLIGDITCHEKQAEDNYKSYFEAHLNLREDDSPSQRDMAREFCDAVRRRSRYRCLAVTERGYFGAIPEAAEIGDWICMFHGGKHLFVIRESGPNFVYLGHAYIHGLMCGEVLRADWYKEVTITLV